MTTNTDIFFTVVSTVVILLLLIFVIASLILFYNGKQVAHKLELRRIRSDFDQELLKSQLEITEHTLQNVSREIHDNIGQMLALANLMLSDAEYQGTDRKVHTAMNLITSSIQSLRDLSRTLDSDLVVKTGLVNCIRTEIELMEKSGKYETSLNIRGDQRDLDGSRQLLVYRVVQESITNILKHAQATRVDVTIHFHSDEMQIIVTDNGIGFDPSAKQVHGAGFRNMRYRMQLVEGTLEVESGPDTGTKVTIHVPFKKSNTYSHEEIQGSRH